MQDILRKYKERLINISSSNRSLVLKKLYKKSSFDLLRLKKFDSHLPEGVIDFITTRKKGSIKIITDPYKWEEVEVKTLKNTLSEELEDKTSQIKAKQLSGDNATAEAQRDYQAKKQEEINKLQKEYQLRQEKEIEKVKKQAEEIISYSTSLSYLIREINAIEKEKGRYELFIGYPFVEGYFKDKTFVKAPLLLYPIKAIKDGDNWLIENIPDQNILLNKVFLLAFSKYNNIPIKDIETEFDDLGEVGLDTFEGLLKYLEAINITIKVPSDNQLSRFTEYDSKATFDYSPGELVLKNNLILGQFPVANSIYNDYLLMEKEEVKNPLLKELLINGEQDRLDNPVAEIVDIKEKIKEKDYYFISPLDYSQEKAVHMVNEAKQLVIYGPPGTGKSQTIANIISHNLALGKKILMVSQKRAALDVIYNRVANLNSKVVLLHDANKDKKAFYEKVANHLETIQVHTASEHQTLETIQGKAVTVDNHLELLDMLGEVLHKKRDFGLSLQQMYSKSSKVASREDDRYEDFKVFRSKNEFSEQKYQEIVQFVNEIIKMDITENYINYRTHLDNNETILKIREDIDCFEIEEFIEKIEALKVKYNGDISLKLQEDNWTTRLLEACTQENNLLTDQQLMGLKNELNREANGQMLEKLNDNRWWSISYWLNYSKNKRLEEANRLEFERKGQDLYQKLVEHNAVIKDFHDEVNFIKDIVVKNEYHNYLRMIFSKTELTESLNKLVKALELYENFRNLIIGLNNLTEIQKKVLNFAYEQSPHREDIISLIKKVPEFAILVNINTIESNERDMILKYKDFRNITQEINQLMQEKQKIIPSYITQKWDQRFGGAMEQSKAKEKELRRQATKKRALWPIRKYLKDFHDVLFELFPCWLLGPETVSEILPTEDGIFDLIIFDEASQMFIENAVPTIYRGKTIVIAGDDKQLRPSSSFKVKFDDEEEYDDLETAAALEEESLLDLAKVNYQSVYLNYHYRSRYDELINFSNYAFYKGRLEVSPNIVKTQQSQIKPIERIKVQGKWVDRKNLVEAEKVVELVSDLLKNRTEKETIGIITFNITQKDLIEDLLDHRATKDMEFKVLYNSEIERNEDNEDLSLFVKNIENVQGDERDVIIFSTGYARNESGKLSVNFGSLSQDGGENRLNVAISRAKKKVYVVTSIEPEELNVDGTKNNGPKLFKKYLQYTREISEGNNEAANIILNSLVDTGVGTAQVQHFDSDFEVQVYEALKDKGYAVDTQVGVSGYKIDLAIYDEKTSRYILGIECDGAAYHSSKTARERDIHRQRYLESRGWNIKRIWSKDWWENPNQEIEKLQKYLELIN